MTERKILELVKQGDAEATTSVINYLLQDKCMIAKAAFRDTCLVVLLTSDQVPDQESSVAFIHKVVKNLGIASLQSVELYGKQIGQESVAWKACFDLLSKPEEPKKQLSILRFKPLSKVLLFSCLVLAALGTYLVQQFKVEEVTMPLTFQSPLPEPSVSAITPSPISANPSPTSQPAPFRDAVNTAMSAAKQAQVAKSSAEWKTVASQWQEAINLMTAVPESSSNYAVAQKKVSEYQRNLDYANLAANRAK